MKIFIQLVVLAVTAVTEIHGFDRGTLRDITRNALEKFVVELDFTGNATFTNAAIRTIVQTTGNLDRTREGLRHRNSFWSFYDEEFALASQRLIDVKAATVTTMTIDGSPDKTSSREMFGEALHTLQDFYSHTNWVKLGNTEINSDLGNTLIPDPPSSLETCDANGAYMDSVADLTSGYEICRGIRSNVPSGKCCKTAIDKEDDATSKSLAAEATTDFLNQLMEDLRVADPTEVAIRSFLGRDESVVFLIDTTESMREELDSIKGVIADFVARFEGNQLGRYILLAFGDLSADTDSAIVLELITPDPDALVDAVMNLNADANGGDECREAGLDVLETALEMSPRRSNIYYWSDASQQGTELGPIPYEIRIVKYIRLRVLAIVRRVRINFVMTGRCLPFGTSYRRFKSLARVTGGKVYHFEDPDEMISVLLANEEIIEFNIDPDEE